MAQQVKAFGQILQFPDGMSEDDMAEAIRSNEPDLNPDYKAPTPEALDYAKGFASGANKLVSGVGYLAEVAGANETGKAIREFGDRGAAYWNAQMSPGGKKAAESQVFVDDPESITGLRLGDDAGKALLMGAAQSLPSMFAAALPGVAITKGIQALASLGLAGGAGATIPLLAGTAAPVGIGSQVIARAPAAVGFGSAEGVVSGGMNAAGLKSSIEGMSDKELLKSPVYQALRAQHGEEKARTMLADQAASDLFGKTAVSTGAIGALTGGGALGSAYQKVTSGAADGILMTGLKGAGQEAIQETPQSGGEKYIENITRKEYLDPSVDPMSGVIAEAASGGAIGAFTGGIVGAGSAINITKQKITPIADAPTIDDAIVAAHEAIRTEDPTLADVEALNPTNKETVDETQTTIDAGQAQAAEILDIVLPDNSSVKAQWKIVDADQLAASMKEDVNQPRDRTRAASDVQIKSIANAPDYRRLSDSPVMDVGAPVVDQDGRIVAGNGRFAGLSQAYEQGTATEYMNQLREDAARKGLSIEGIAKPVLVRQLSEPVDTRKMAIASNSGTTLQMSALEQANLDAERMKGIENLDVNDLGDIALTPRNLTQLKDSLGSYVGTELGAMVDKGGQLSQEGMRRVRNAMLAKAYGNSPSLEKLVESTDTDMRNVLGALTKSANHIIKTKGDAKPLMEAVDTYSQLKATGQPVDNFLAQQDAFSEGLSKEAEGILRFIDTNVRSQKKLTDFFKGNFVEVDTTSDDMFAPKLSVAATNKINLAEGSDIRETRIGDSTLVYGNSDGKLKLYSIRTPQVKRGAGSARRAMESFVAQADKENKTIFLDASALDKKTSTDKLVTFYKSLGFELTGKKVNPIGEPEMKRSPNVKDTNVKQLEKHLKDNGYDFTVEPASVRDLDDLDSTKKARKELAEKQAKLFKKKVVFVKADGPFRINGVMVPSIADTIFVDIRTDKAFDAIMAHELSHWMEQEKPAVYKELLKSLKTVIINEAEYAKKYGIEGATKAEITKEIVGDLMGDNFTEQSFWQKVAEANPKAFKDIAAAIIKWLKGVIVKAKANGMGSEQWVKDANKAQDIIAKAVAQYTESEAAPVSAESKPKFHKAYHGSPHDHSKFDSSKIGTGEGAQAYGYGHYFAESKDVAEHYKKTLSNDDNYATSDGTVWSPNTLKNLNARVKVRDALRKNTDLTKPIAQVQEMLDRNESEKMREMLRIDLSNLHDIQERGGLKNTLGKLYEVELAPEQDEYLLWDKPLSEQSDKVKSALGYMQADVTFEEAAPYGVMKEQSWSASNDWKIVKDTPAKFDVYDDKGGFNGSKKTLVGAENHVKILSGTNTGGTGELLYKDTADKLIGKYVISEQRVSKRGDLEGNAPTIDHVRKYSYGVYDSVKQAKAEFMRKLDSDLRNASEDYAAKHFDQQQRNEGYNKVERITNGKQAASEYLHSLGIRGIKYLDGSSRAKGEGAYNYVIFDDKDVSITAKFSKAAVENTLIAQHNLSVRNLIHADRMGGLAAPSIAVTDKAHPLTGFGEITLLSNKDLIDPKNGTKIFGSDIYSPRYPSISYDFSGKPIKALNALLAKGVTATGDSEYYNDNLQNDPFRELTHSSAAMYTFLSDQGVEPELAYVKPRDLPDQRLMKFVDERKDSFDLSNDDEFKATVKAIFTDKSDRDDGASRYDMATGYITKDYANQVVAHREAIRNAGKVDRTATNTKLFRQISDANLRNKFDEYLVDLVNKAEPKEKIFKGYTYAGNRQYMPHDIDTVIKILKKDLRGGENFKYGLGSIRAKYSPQFKSIEQIRKSKGMLMNSESFDQVKKEVQAGLDDLNESLTSYGTFSGYDNVETMLSDAAKRGISGALKDNGFENVPDSIKVDIQTFLNKLKDMPTEYFEAKILRAVGLGEFSTAVIPDDSTPQVEAILKKSGIEDIRKYKSGDNEDRVKQINKVTHVMFSRVIAQDGEYLDAVKSGDMDTAQRMVNDKLAIVGALWHGTPSGDLRGGRTGLHVGTKQAAMEALEARIGIPADGRGWDGTRKYGDTLLAGRDRVGSGQFGKYRNTGYNSDSPKDDFYAKDHKLPTVGNGVKVDPSWKPWIRPVVIVGDMAKRKKTDSAANSSMGKLLSKGEAIEGFYYNNIAEDAGSVSAVLPNGDYVKVKLPDPVTYDDKGEVIPLSKRFDKANNDIRFSRAPKLYSKLEQALEAASDKVFSTGPQVKLWLQSNAGKLGIKKDEIYWSGIDNWLDAQGKVSKQQVVEFVRNNGVKVEDVTLGKKAGRTYDEIQEMLEDFNKYPAGSDARRELRAEQSLAEDPEHETKHNNDKLTLPGGTDYKELVVTVPTIEPHNAGDTTHFGDTGGGRQIGWLRMDTRDGGLFIEELQSQRAQQGRSKGFNTPIPKSVMGELERLRAVDFDLYDQIQEAKGDSDKTKELKSLWVANNESIAVIERSLYDNKILVPPAPFVSDANNKATNAYITLLMKKALIEAVSNDHASVSWTTGDQQADRYDLSKQIGRVTYTDDKTLRAYDVNDDRIQVINQQLTDDKELVEYIGKDAAEKLLAQPARKNGKRELSGLALKTGGEWAQSMYGNEQGLNLQGKPSLISQAANDIFKHVGSGKVESINGQPGFYVTPEMKSKDLPLFSRADTMVVDGVERPTTNSEGKPINNPTNFWKWFGDSEARQWPNSSRGNRAMAPPLVLYHGTKGDFNEFVVGSPGTNSTVFGPWETKRAGMFFTKDKKFAESFATQGDSTQGANIIPVYLKVENAIDLTEGFTDDAIIDALAEKGVNPRLMYNISADQIWGMFDEEDDGSFFVSKLKELGYDGAIIVEPNTATDESTETWVVFDPNQIKSAVGNNGDYSRANKDIRFSRAPTTKAFRDWFGDSKVVDEQGKALVVYHGTGQNSGNRGEFMSGDFSTFDPSLSGKSSKTGAPSGSFFFTDSPSVASSYTVKYQGDFSEEYKDSANVMPVYLSIKKPLKVNAKGENWRDVLYKGEYRDVNEIVQLAKESGKYDGVIIKNVMDHGIGKTDNESSNTYVTFLSNQVKSAIGNNGDYSSTNNDIRFSKATTPPDESRLRRFQRMNQDSFNRFTVIKEWLAENGQTLSDKADVYGAEERYHSMAANQLEDFREQQRNPLIEKIQKAGYTLGDIEVFLKMQHAREANAQIRKLGDNPDATAYGITDDESTEYLAEAPENLAKLANEFRAITEQTKKLRLDAGILNTDITDAWEGAYKHYVPVKGEDDSTRGVGKGLKTNFKSKRRLGHSLRDEHVIENILMDHERAILEVERNRVGKHLVMMAAEMQRPDILSIEQPEKRKMLKESTAYTVEANGVVQGVFKSREEAKMFKQFYAASMPKVAPSAIVINQTKDQRVIASASPMLAENEVNVYMNGHAIRVQINDELLARAYTKMGVEQFSDIVGAGRILNGYLSKVYTGYNPEFILTNMIRDFSSGTINLTGEQGFGMATKALTNYPRMFTDLLKYAATNGKSSTKWINSYRANGGNTGAAYLSDMERLGNEVNTEYASYQGVLSNLKQGDTANAARAAGRKVFNATLKWIYNLNQAGENAMRLAAFKAMIDSGRTVNEATKVAKNITVNFNRKGERQWTPALYLFYNASVQGTAATAHALTKGKHKGQAWALAGSMAAVGYMVAAAFGGGSEDDWDEINEYTKERNLLIKSGDGYLKIPIPYGYGFFYNLGRFIADAQRTGDWGKTAWHLATSAISEFTPFNDVVVGSDEEFRSDQVFMGLLPTAMKIVAQPTFNKQLFSGSELMPESQFDKSQPDRQKMFRSTKGTMYDTVAGWLEAAGIAAGLPEGVYDISPETLKYLVRTGTGGAGSLVDTGISAAMLKAEGAELDTQEIPFVRKAYMELGIKDKRAAHYKVREEARTAAEEFNRARRDNDVAKMQDVLKDKKELIALDRYANKLASTIDAARDQQDAVRADKNLSVQEKRLKLKDMEATEAKFYDQYLDVFKASVKR